MKCSPGCQLKAAAESLIHSGFERNDAVFRVGTQLVQSNRHNFGFHTISSTNSAYFNLGHIKPCQVIPAIPMMTRTTIRQATIRLSSIAGRFRFFLSYGEHSPFYQKVAKPLMSMRTVGSIDVERRIKPLKHDIITKKRNKLRDPKGVALYRASENLHHLMRAKQSLGMKISDSLLSKTGNM